MKPRAGQSTTNRRRQNGHGGDTSPSQQRSAPNISGGVAALQHL
jgi:hypothetical protein